MTGRHQASRGRHRAPEPNMLADDADTVRLRRVTDEDTTRIVVWATDRPVPIGTRQ